MTAIGNLRKATESGTLHVSAENIGRLNKRLKTKIGIGTWMQKNL